ncbi:YIP1 family protein [Helicovermis profundi]|uniref:Yip1 domain-containing protein n=1 Tax=Helicovermis profundi TaxID=3065157 RepID=A0AAU9E0M4_9FIRM|nr:hypothetical protein HLPR_02550 [Clostridia bacterium S502]
MDLEKDTSEVNNDMDFIEIPEEVLEEFKEENLQPKLNIFARMAKIITSPNEVMEDVNRKTYVWIYILIFAVIAGAMYFLQIDAYKDLFYKQFAKNPTIDMTNADAVAKIMKISVISGGIGYLLSFAVMVPLFKGIVSHVLSIFMGSKAKLSKSIGVVMNAYTIVVIGEVLRTALVLVTGTITSSFSLAMILPASSQQTILYAFLGMISLFSIWYLYVSVKGFKVVHKLSTAKATFVVVSPYVLLFLLSIIPILLKK